MQSPLRRITNTTQEGISTNPTMSGDGRIVAFESTEDIAGAGGSEGFRAIRANVSVDPVTFLQLGSSRAPAPGISQDGSRIAFASKDDPLGTNTDRNSEIFLYDGAKLIQVTNTSAGDIAHRTVHGNFQPSISDDGRFIAFSSNRDLASQNTDGNLEIFVFDSVALSFGQLTNSSGTVGFNDAKISGNGSAVAYIRDTGITPSAKRDLLLQNRVGSAPARLLASNAQPLALTYGRAVSDDGLRVVWEAETATNSSQVFLYDGRDDLTRQITSLATRVSEVPLNPTICGDGSRIAFATRRTLLGNSDGSVDLYSFDIPSATFTRVTSGPSDATGEVLSSMNDDGSLIAFNFPRVLSGGVSREELANNSEIYVTATTPRPAFGTLTVLNGASFGHEPSTTKAVAPDSVAVARGAALANTTEQSQRQPDGTFPLTVGNTTVTVNGRPAQIFFVSPTQVNFHVPPATELGTAEVIVTNSDGFRSRGNVTTLSAAPGVFTFSGDGLGEGVILNADTLQPGPFDPTNSNLRLIVFSTGVRNGSVVSMTAGGRALTLESIARSPNMHGLDEVHVLVPADLRGAGTVDLVIRADARDSSPVAVAFVGDGSRDIVINEFLSDPPEGSTGDANHDGTRDSGDDEFVELVNTTTHDIDISGYQILTRSGSGSSDTVRFTFAAGSIMPACSAVVIFGGGTFDRNNPAFAGAQVFKVPTAPGLSLINSGGVITLRDQAAVIVNLVSYGGSTGLDGDANQSLTRSPDATGGFTLHQSSGSAGRLFSPGARVNGSAFSVCGIVTRIEVSPSSATINEGAKQQFNTRALDANNQEVFGVLFSWQSSNTTVATIDQNGLATGEAPGSAEIRASGRGVESPPATLTVLAVQRVLTRIEVTPNPASIPVGGSQQFTARSFDQFDNEIPGLTFIWESSDTNVATIDANGLASGAHQGQTTIRASSQGVAGSAPLNVTAPTVVFNEVLADPAGSAGTDLEGDANHDGVRSASDDEFVEFLNSTGAGISISGWTVRTHSSASPVETTRHTFAASTTLPAGEAIVVFGGGAFDPANPVFGCAQVVKASSGGLSLTNSGLTIVLRDGSGNLVAQFSYGGTTGLTGDSDQSLTRSPDVTGNFVLHTAAAGANGRNFSPGLKVDGTPFGNCPGHLTSVTIAPGSTGVAVGQSTQFTAQALDEYGRAMTGITPTFASDNTNVATVDSVSTNPGTGVAIATVTGQNQGTAHVTASAMDGTTTVVSPQATLSVIPRVTRVDVLPASALINRGNTQQFTATAFDQNNQPLPGTTFTWLSSNTNIATIDTSGLANGVGIGTVTITAQTPDGQGGTASGTATVKVLVPLVVNEIGADVAPDNISTTAMEGDVNRDGVRDSDDDEFVELLNNSSAAVDVSGVIVADGASNRFTFPANTTLAAGRAVIIFGGGTPPAGDPAFGGALILTTSSLSLNDTADTVIVKLPFSGADVLIDSQAYGGTSGVSAPSDQSLTRSPDAEVGAAAGGFVAHTTATDAAGRIFSPGTRADGTPFGSPPIARIEVIPGEPRIDVGGTQVFTGHAFSNSGGPEIEIQNVSFIWESSDPTRATLAPTTGQTTTATAVASGTTTIRARAGAQQGTGALSINPTLSINDVSLNEDDGGTTTFSFTVSLSTAAPSGGVTFDIATQDNTATVADNDYVAKTLTLQTIPAGSSTYNFDVIVNGDLTIEANEIFFVNVTSVSGATVSDAQGVGAIQNDDSPTLTINDVTAAETNDGTTAFTFTVTSSLPAPAGGITFDIATADGTAQDDNLALSEDNDYVAMSLTGQTITASNTTYTFDVTVNGDTLVESNETFFVNVTNVTNATVSDSQGQGTIQNDDTANLVISQLYGGGGNAGATYQNDFIEIFNRGTTSVSLSGWSVQYASATGTTWQTTNLSGTLQPGQYYLVQEGSGGAIGSPLPTPDASGTIAMAAGSGKVALLNSTHGLTGACPSSANIFDMVGYGATANCFEGGGPAPAPSATTANVRKVGGCTDTNDNATDFLALTPTPRNTSSPLNDCSAVPPNLTIDDVTVTEGNGGPVTATFTVNLSTPAPAAGVTFDIATQDNSATVADNDYLNHALTGQTIASENQTFSFSVTVNGDTNVEPNETFLVNVTNVNGANVVDSQGVGRIDNDDSTPLPNLTIDDVSIAEGHSGPTTFTFTVSLSAPAPPAGVTFDIATADVTAQDDTPATEDNDYVLKALTSQTITSGNTTYIFSVTVNGDTVVEPNETFTVNVTNITGANPTDTVGQGTIQNDDGANVVISQIYGAGGNAGATYQNDFIEIFNRSTAPVNLTGWSVQYAAATGTTWQVTNLSGTIQPGQYYLIQQAGGANGISLPTPDATGTISMAAGAGKVALLNVTTALSGACPSSANIMDFVGYGATANCFEGAGPTPVPGTTNSAMRAESGCKDSGNNNTDFTAAPVAPRNTSIAGNICP